MNGERLWLALEGRHGLLEEPPSKDSFIALTNQRLISFIREGHKQRRVLLSLDNVDSVEVADSVICMDENVGSDGPRPTHLSCRSSPGAA